MTCQLEAIGMAGVKLGIDSAQSTGSAMSLSCLFATTRRRVYYAGSVPSIRYDSFGVLQYMSTSIPS